MFEVGRKLVNQSPVVPATVGHFLTSAARRLGRRLFITGLRLCIPCVCGLCGGAGQWHRHRGGLDLCEHCEAALPRVVHRDEEAAPALAGAAVAAAFDYAPPVDFMIRQLKFGGDRSFARTLGLLLAEQHRERRGPLPDALVPVPLHFDRLRERGYNQALELARVAGRVLRIPVLPRVLGKTRATRAQSGLGASDRAGNVRGCFAVDPRRAESLRGRRVALVDDVLTTGSTAAEAACALRDAGAAAVEVWTACRASGQRK